MKLLKLGTIVRDMATRLYGMLTHVQIAKDGSEFYNFQPKGLNLEDGTPVKGIWVTHDRICDGKRVDVDMPMELLGTVVEDLASGYKGTVTSLTLHIDGCIHALVQASGRSKKTGNAVESCDFDIRRLKGKKVPVFTEPELKKSILDRPSPILTEAYTPRV